MKEQLDAIRAKYDALIQSVDLETLNIEEQREIKRVETMLNTAYSRYDHQSKGQFFVRLMKTVQRLLYSVIDWLASIFWEKSEDDLDLTPEEELWIARAIGEVVGIQIEPEKVAASSEISRSQNQLEISIKQSLSSPINLKAVRDVSKQVLGKFKSSELVIFDDLVDTVLNITAQGRLAAVGGMDMPGGIGTQDLMIVVVVPVVAVIVDEVLHRLGLTTVEQLKQKLNKGMDIKAQLKIKVSDVERMSNIIKHLGGKKEIEELTNATNAALLEYLHIE